MDLLLMNKSEVIAQISRCKGLKNKIKFAEKHLLSYFGEASIDFVYTCAYTADIQGRVDRAMERGDEPISGYYKTTWQLGTKQQDLYHYIITVTRYLSDPDEERAIAECQTLKSVLIKVAKSLSNYFGSASDSVTFAVPPDTDIDKIAAEVIKETVYYTLQINWKKIDEQEGGREVYEFTLKRIEGGVATYDGVFDNMEEDKENEKEEKPAVSTYATELVFKRICEERAYQDSFVDEKGLCKKHPVVAELLQMEEYLARARTAWVNGKGDTEALHMIRKVLAIGVRCGENHPLPKR